MGFIVGALRFQLGLSLLLEAVLLLAVAMAAGVALGVALQHFGIAFVADATGLVLRSAIHASAIVEACAAALAARALAREADAATRSDPRRVRGRRPQADRRAGRASET